MAQLVQCDTCVGEGWIAAGKGLIEFKPWSEFRGSDRARWGYVIPFACPACVQRGVQLAPDVGERQPFTGWPAKPMPPINE